MRKVVLVTGGNRGIGLEICKQLAEKDYTVLLTARNMAIGRPLVNELRKQWKTIWFHQLDVTDETSIRDLCSYLDEACGQVDILINNAGIISDQDTNVEVVDPEVVRETMETNLYGPLRLAQV